MASSYSDLGLELMVTGENAGTWGDKTNSNLNLIQQSVAGYEAVALTDGGTVTLAMTDATLSNARNMVIKFTGTLTTASTVTIPNGIEKFYIFDCSAVVGPTNLTIKTVSGTGFTLNAAKIFAAYSDGTNLNEISLDTLGGTIAAADITGTISTAQIADNAITTAKISDNQITTAKISDNQITTAKIANDAVGPNQLSNTAVTPAEYTSATITVDAQGRITAASSGAGGAGGFLLKNLTVAGSGTWTANPGANLGAAYIMSAGGGGGGGSHPPQGGGGAGGDGAYGYYSGPVNGGSSNPFVAGAGGNPGAGNPSNPGSAPGGTGGVSNTLGFTVNGGNGGNGGGPGATRGNPGTAGTNAPGVDVSINRELDYLMSGGAGGARGAPPGGNGATGQDGFVIIYDNGGT